MLSPSAVFAGLTHRTVRHDALKILSADLSRDPTSAGVC